MWSKLSSNIHDEQDIDNFINLMFEYSEDENLFGIHEFHLKKPQQCNNWPFGSICVHHCTCPNTDVHNKFNKIF